MPKRFEVRANDSNQLLGYVNADTIDLAYDLATAKYGDSVWLVSINNPRERF